MVLAEPWRAVVVVRKGFGVVLVQWRGSEQKVRVQSLRDAVEDEATQHRRRREREGGYEE